MFLVLRIDPDGLDLSVLVVRPRGLVAGDDALVRFRRWFFAHSGVAA